MSNNNKKILIETLVNWKQNINTQISISEGLLDRLNMWRLKTGLKMNKDTLHALINNKSYCKNENNKELISACIKYHKKHIENTSRIIKKIEKQVDQLEKKMKK